MPTHTYETDGDWARMHGHGGDADLAAMMHADHSVAWAHESNTNVFAKFARAAIAANAGRSWGPENPHYVDWAEVVEDQPYN